MIRLASFECTTTIPMIKNANEQVCLQHILNTLLSRMHATGYAAWRNSQTLHRIATLSLLAALRMTRVPQSCAHTPLSLTSSTVQ